MNALLEQVSTSPEDGREILDAATREAVGYAPRNSIEDVDQAVSAAKEAQPSWAALGHEERARILVSIADDIDAHADELGEIITAEQGKIDGAGEVHGAAHWLRTTARTRLEPTVLSAEGSSRSELHYVPLGVVASIGPWNFPVMIASWHISPALRMGNSVIVKPSEYTPLSVHAFVALCNKHLPAGVLQVISGSREVSSTLAAHPGLSKIIFTGSTPTGRKIIESSAQSISRLTLELGGNDAGIVLPGTPVDEVAEKIFWAAFMNTGQVCAALKRLYVHDSVHDEVVRGLAELANNTPMGPGTDKANKLGPIQNPHQLAIVKRLVDDARERGCTIAAGGEPALELGELFFQPTIVADIDDGAPLVDEEQFGPVLPVIRYADVDDAIRRANGTAEGLGASVWGPSVDEALTVAEQLNAGTVWINQHGGVDPEIPFGGMKASGYGLEFGSEGLKEMAATRVIRR